MIIDSHHHLWDLSKFHYSWMSPDLKVLYRNYLPADLEETVKPFCMQGTVVVQAHQSLEETYWLLDLATKSELILGVVGWVDLKDPQLDRTLAELQAHPKFKGVRHLIQDEPDTHWMLQAEVVRGLKSVHDAGLAYDLLVRPPHLENSLRLMDQLPGMPIILDHIAKPFIKAGIREPWAQQMQRLAQFPHLYCKVSGLITEADHQHWRTEDFVFYLQHILDVFGWERICWGSDWPVCLLAGGYSQVLDLPAKVLKAQATEPQWSQFMGFNAARFYRLLRS